jgi:hypothetical protein
MLRMICCACPNDTREWQTVWVEYVRASIVAIFVCVHQLFQVCCFVLLFVDVVFIVIWHC